METVVRRLGVWALVLLAAIAAIALTPDSGFAIHMGIVALVAVILIAVTATSYDPMAKAQGIFKMPPGPSRYDDDVIRWGVIATMFWGLAGLLAGVFIAAQLAFPQLNFEPYLNFGRVRPLHTSAVIFAFGGNALLATSFYVVQRTCRTTLAFPGMARFVFWGYQLFIVLAATGYLLGISQGKEYAEPEWYVDLWLTVVWLCYLAVFVGTLLRRHEPHIYVANWFYLAFIVTIAMLHVVNNLAMPVSLLGGKSYSAFAGVQDALTQWWYGHNAVGFFLTAGFLAMMYYFVPKQAGRPVYSYRLSIIHFWSLIFLYIWAGPHHLHYTALPDWAQTLGMVFSVMLWMPSWGGMINGLMTLNGAWDKVRTDPIIRMMVLALAFYGMSTFEGPMLSIKAVNSPEPLHRLDHRPRPFRRAGMERDDHLRLRLLPRAAPVAEGAAVSPAHDQLALLARDFGDRFLRLLDVGRRDHPGPDVARIWVGRIPGEQLRRHRRRAPPDVHPARCRRADVPQRCDHHGLQRLDDHRRQAAGRGSDGRHRP